MHIWIVIREEKHSQTSETLKIEFVQAFTGDDEETVKQAAGRRVEKLMQEHGGYSFVDYTPLDTYFWAEKVPVIEYLES